MSLRIYDTRQRRKVQFEPRKPGKVGMYTCGPTVYSDATIGNFRAYMFEDLLRRTLKFLGYQVTQVMNLTDVDDKTIREANARNISLKEITAPVTERFFKDLDTLNIERAEHYPAATEHISEMIDLIELLIAKGNAYNVEKSIYYRVNSFPDYGRLSGMNLEKLAKGVRIDSDEYERDDFRDFALWKGWTEEDGDVYWESPFGRGRPGWHIECSAMSRKYLGEEFDIHTGGVDNIFPHHENEIAQSVAASGKTFSKYWMHCAHLKVDGEKMSKSLGNVYVLEDLLNKGYSPRTIRYVLLSAHYRQTLNFTHEAVEAATHSLERLDTLYQAACMAAGNGSVRSSLHEELKITRNNFSAALEDDLGISEALAVLFKLVSVVHQAAQETPLNKAEGVAIKVLWADIDRVLGFLIPKIYDLPEEIIQAIQNRYRYRSNRQFAEADHLRDELVESGYHLEDMSGGTVVIWSGGRKFIGFDANNA